VWLSMSYQYSPRVNSFVSRKSPKCRHGMSPVTQGRLHGNTVLHEAKIARRLQLKIDICRLQTTTFALLGTGQITTLLRIRRKRVSFTRHTTDACNRGIPRNRLRAGTVRRRTNGAVFQVVSCSGSRCGRGLHCPRNFFPRRLTLSPFVDSHDPAMPALCIELDLVYGANVIGQHTLGGALRGVH
jgi:hypothetical protein